MLLGVTKKSKVYIREIWSPDSIHHLHWATATMSRSRFEQLLSILSFDVFSTREERKQADPKFFKMSEVFNRFKKKISNAFEPSNNLCIDETLTPFRGKI